MVAFTETLLHLGAERKLEGRVDAIGIHPRLCIIDCRLEVEHRASTHSSNNFMIYI
jgi:hypothetical protein